MKLSPSFKAGYSDFSNMLGNSERLRHLLKMNILALIICLIVVAPVGFVQAAFASDISAISILRFGNYPNQTCGFTLVGEINKEKLAKLEMHLASVRNPQTCELDETGKPAYTFFKTLTLIDSPGGDLDAAVEIIKLVKKHKLVTHVDELISGKEGCLSSCALIFAAGDKRHYTNPTTLDSASQNIVLGIHKPYFLDRSYEYLKTERMLDKVKYALIDLYRENELDPRFTINMFETPSKDIRFPKIADMLIWRVISSLSLPEFYRSAGIQKTSCQTIDTYLNHINAVVRLNQVADEIKLGKKKTLSDGSELSLERVLTAKKNALACLNYNFLE